MLRALLPFLTALLFLNTSVLSADQSIRVGLLKFGTVAWEIETIARHRLDRARAITVTAVEFATNEAAKVALQADAVDVIVTDWPWVARQRAEGADFSFVPYSKAVGSLVVPRGSTIDGLAALRGKRIGVVGGPLDKSWILLRALSRRELGQDLAEIAEPVFGAPPLLNEELARGRIDAVLTYWHYAARLEAAGARPLLSVAEIIRRLGIEAEVPMLGYAFRGEWAARNREALQAFVAASQAAKERLAGSQQEWTALAPLVGSNDEGVLSALRAGYAAGVPKRWGEAERRAAADLYAILAQLGGERLVGRARSLDPATFSPLVSY